jgi:hypothetical protein
MEDIKKLIEANLPFVETLLTEYGEFYPLACAIYNNDDIKQVGTHFGEEHPSSNDVLTELKNVFRATKDDYKTIGIFYDVKIIDPNTGVKTHAVATFLESKSDDKAFTFYFPYQLTDGQLVYSESWGNENDKEIFLY